MAEYISRDDLLNAINTNVAEAHSERCSQLLEAILNAPTADVDEVRHGHWKYNPNGIDWGLGAWECSLCRCRNDNLPMDEKINPRIWAGSKFCPNCGAKMDGESNVLNVTAESAVKALQDAAREFKDIPPGAYLELMIGSTMQY